MAARVSTLLLAVCAVVTGAAPTAAFPHQDASVPRPVPMLPAARACRSVVPAPPPAMALFDFTSRVGGMTCFDRGEVVLFAPAGAEGCALPPFPVAQTRSMERSEALDDWTQCAAVLRSGSPTPVPTILYRPRSNTEEALREMALFGADVLALASHDGLPVTYVMNTGESVCLEAPDPALVRARIREADIADDSRFDVTERLGGCENMQRQIDRARGVD